MPVPVSSSSAIPVISLGRWSRRVAAKGTTGVVVLKALILYKQQTEHCWSTVLLAGQIALVKLETPGWHEKPCNPSFRHTDACVNGEHFSVHQSGQVSRSCSERIATGAESVLHGCTVVETSIAPSPCSQVLESTLLTLSTTLPASNVAVTCLVRNRYDEARVLLREGAQIDTADAEGNAPLMLASRAGHGRLVKLLVRKRANPDALNAEGKTAEQLATQYHHKGIATFLRDSYASSHGQSKP